MVSDWLIGLHWVTFLWLLGWAVRAVLNICSKDRRSVSFLLLIFFVFYGAPIVLDLTAGTPEYASFPGFRDSTQSEPVNVVYDAFVMACPVFWWFTTRSPRRTSRRLVIPGGTELQLLLWALLVSPVIAVCFSPEPSVYLSYGAVLRNTMSFEALDFHAIVGALTILALIAGAGLLIIRRDFHRTLWLIMPLVTFAVWVEGKRTAVALSLMLLWAVAWMRGFLTRSKAIGFGAISLILLAGYAYRYQQTLRPFAVNTGYDTYENSRIDYGRDHDLKAAIFCELSDGSERILDYRGESLLFDLTMYVPRSLWPEKPSPYPNYLTNYALKTRYQLGELSWGFTTSFLDEAVANFGWAGLLIGPMVFSLLCRLCDRSPDPLVKGVGVLVAGLLMTVVLVAFAPLMIVWFLYLAWSRYSLRRAPGKLSILKVHAMRAET